MNRNKLTDIYNKYVDDLNTYGLYLGFERDTVKDAIHDIFVKISSDNRVLNNIENIKFYLFKSLKNRLTDLYRKNKRLLAIENFNPDEETPFQIQVTVESKYIEEEDRVRTKEEIEEMLESLTHRQREIIYLRYVQEYDYEQISEILNITVHSCRKLVSKAINSLRNKYGVISLLFLVY